MKIKFAFPIQIVNECEVELIEGRDPIMQLHLNPDVQSLVSDKTMDKVYKKAIKTIILSTMKVTY